MDQIKIIIIRFFYIDLDGSSKQIKCRKAIHIVFQAFIWLSYLFNYDNIALYIHLYTKLFTFLDFKLFFYKNKYSQNINMYPSILADFSIFNILGRKTLNWTRTPTLPLQSPINTPSSGFT